MMVDTPSVEFMNVMEVALLGLGTGLALIIAIGAQNVYVLRMGIAGTHVLPIVLVCAASDAVLIAAGILGLGPLISAAPGVLMAFRWVGAAFLLVYALLAARRAWRPAVLDAGTINSAVPASAAQAPAKAASLGAALATVLALTWLNPHVYLDTVLLLGSLANTHGSSLRWAFGVGAMLGSVLWFSALGFGAAKLRTFFAKKSSWRILDSVIALTMLALAVKLAVGR